MTTVAIEPTHPQTVMDDYANVLDLVDYQSFINQELDTIIKINLSWSLFYPACSTPPWQLDGVLNKLIEDGFDPKTIIPVENQTVNQKRWMLSSIK